MEGLGSRCRGVTGSRGQWARGRLGLFRWGPRSGQRPAPPARRPSTHGAEGGFAREPGARPPSPSVLPRAAPRPSHCGTGAPWALPILPGWPPPEGKPALVPFLLWSGAPGQVRGAVSGATPSPGPSPGPVAPVRAPGSAWTLPGCQCARSRGVSTRCSDRQRGPRSAPGFSWNPASPCSQKTREQPQRTWGFASQTGREMSRLVEASSGDTGSRDQGVMGRRRGARRAQRARRGF